MTIELKSVCGYIRTNAKDRTFDERLAFLKSVIELHEDWKCEDILIDRSGLLGINRPSLASIVEKMENGELKYIVVTHFAVIHPNVEILQKFVNKLKGLGCGVVALQERVNTLFLDQPLKDIL